jgi:hypothetical protein
VRDLEDARAQALHLKGALRVVTDRRPELVAHHDHRDRAGQERDRAGDNHASRVPLATQERGIEEERECLDRDPYREQSGPGGGAAPVAGEDGGQHEEGGHEIESIQCERPVVDHGTVEDHPGERHQPDGVDAERGEHASPLPRQSQRDQQDDREIEREHLPHESVDESLG